MFQVALYLPSGNELLGVMKSEIDNIKTFQILLYKAATLAFYFSTL